MPELVSGEVRTKQGWKRERKDFFFFKIDPPRVDETKDLILLRQFISPPFSLGTSVEPEWKRKKE